MIEGLQEDQLAGALEAMLFVTDEPVGIITFSDMLEVPPAQVEATLVELRDRLAAENRGIQLREVAGGWRLYTHPAYHELIEKYVISWDTRKLSQAALETLAIVAYQQPITRAGVASVRGVNSDSSLNSLVEKGLVREAGTAEAPGSPTLYATTRRFLERFGLRTLADLPDLAQFAPDDETRDLIRERLSAASENPQVTGVGDADAAEDEEREGREAPRAEASPDGLASSRSPFEGLSFDFDNEDAIELSAPGMSATPAAPAMPTTHETPAAPAMPATHEASSRLDISGGAGAGEPVRARSAHAELVDAMATSLGLVDKIDFSQLRFETDDE